MGRIFISHRNTPADNDVAAQIHRWLKDQKGIAGFLDFDIQDGLQAGQRWEDEIYAAMNRAHVVIAVVSKAWLESDWCLSEARMARLLGRRLILIITEECKVPFRETQSIRLEKHGAERAFAELRQALRNSHNPPDRPYPGLVAFDEPDAAVFFGREDETRALENQIDQLFRGRPETPRLLLLLGASGSGKSSLMRAGLIPGFGADPTRLAIKPIIPRGNPLGELARALGLRFEGVDADGAVTAILDRIGDMAPGYERVLLPIDQAEELLRGDNGPFFDVLRGVLAQGEGRIIALATMRSDFLNAFQQSGLIGTGTPLSYDTFTLDPLPQDRLPDIIQKPAEIYGVTFEEGLIARIMEDHGGPDALPLLAFFLSEFWRKEYISDGILQVPEYDSFGGLDKALKRAVERATHGCKAVEPDAGVLMQDLRELFLGRLVAVRAGSGEPVRRRAAADRLTDRQVALLKVFARERLLIERDGTWEVVHEALLRQWGELAGWIAEAHDDLVAIDRIKAAATHWEQAGHGEADLTHGGNRLAEAFRMLESPLYAQGLDGVPKAYLEACRQKENDRYEKEKALREDAERQRDLAEVRSAEAEAAKQAAEAQKAAAEAEARRALRGQRFSLAALSSIALKSGRPEEAAYLGLAAWPRSADAREDLSEYRVVLKALTDVLPSLREVRRLVIGTGENGHWATASKLAISSDGRHVALASLYGPSLLWRINADGSVSRREVEPAQDSLPDELGFSPDGRYLFHHLGSERKLWDMTTVFETGEPVTGVPDHAISASQPYAFDRSSGKVTDRRNGRLVTTLIGHPAVREFVFHRGGTRATFSDARNRIWLWDMEPGCEVEILKDIPKQCEVPRYDDENDVFDVGCVVSPDGAFVALWDCNTVRIFDVLSEKEVLRTGIGENSYPGCHIGTFSACGTLWAGFSLPRSDKTEVTVRMWDLRIGSQAVVVPGPPVEKAEPEAGKDVAAAPAGASVSGVQDIRCGPDGTRLTAAIKSADGVNVVTWDLETGKETANLHFPANDEGTAPDVVLSPYAELAAVAGYTERAFNEYSNSEYYRREDYRVLDTVAGQEISTLEYSSGQWLRFLGDGRSILTSSNTSVRIANVESGEASVSIYNGVFSTETYPDLQFNGRVTAVAASPDASCLVIFEDSLTFIAVGDDFEEAINPYGAQMRLWDVATGRPIGTWDIDDDIAPSGEDGMVFSPCGELVAMARSGERPSVTLHHYATGEQVGQIRFAEAPYRVTEMSYSPDGFRLAIVACFSGERSSQDEDRVELFDTATGQRIAQLPCPAGCDCLTFSPDGRYLFIGMSDGSIHCWNVAHGPGNLFDIVYRRMPVLSPPAIASDFGIELDDTVYSGDEPLPNAICVPPIDPAQARDLHLGYPVPVVAPRSTPWPVHLLPARLGDVQLVTPPPGSPLERWGLPPRALGSDEPAAASVPAPQDAAPPPEDVADSFAPRAAFDDFAPPPSPPPLDATPDPFADPSSFSDLPPSPPPPPPDATSDPFADPSSFGDLPPSPPPPPDATPDPFADPFSLGDLPPSPPPPPDATPDPFADPFSLGDLPPSPPPPLDATPDPFADPSSFGDLPPSPPPPPDATPDPFADPFSLGDLPPSPPPQPPADTTDPFADPTLVDSSMPAPMPAPGFDSEPPGPDPDEAPDPFSDLTKPFRNKDDA